MVWKITRQCIATAFFFLAFISVDFQCCVHLLQIKLSDQIVRSNCRSSTFESVTHFVLLGSRIITTGVFTFKRLCCWATISNRKHLKCAPVIAILTIGVLRNLLAVRVIFLSDSIAKQQNGSEKHMHLITIDTHIMQLLDCLWEFLLLIQYVVLLKRIRDFTLEIENVGTFLKLMLRNEFNSCYFHSLNVITQMKLKELISGKDGLQKAFGEATLFLTCQTAVYLISLMGFFSTLNLIIPLRTICHLIMKVSLSIAYFETMAEASDNLERKKSELTETLSHLALKYLSYKERVSAQIIHQLRSSLLQKNFCLNACGLFTLNKQLVVTMTGVLVTYCVLISQAVIK